MKYTIIFFLAVFFGSCHIVRQMPSYNLPKESTQALLWQQQSGEYKALCYQAYSLAKFRLQQRLAERKANGITAKPLALVTDVDETLVDNSYYYVHLIRNNLSNDRPNWEAWTKLAKATALPGAVELLQWADSQGIHIFYVTNRETMEMPATMANLAKLGFPQVMKEHFYPKNTVSSSKELRRQNIHQHYDIALLLGGNLGDFFEAGDLNNAIRNEKVARQRSVFGEYFIILPNPVYGGWEVEKFYTGTPLNLPGIDSLRQTTLLGY